MNKHNLLALALLFSSVSGQAQTFTYGNFFDAKAGGAPAIKPDCRAVQGLYQSLDANSEIEALNINIYSPESGMTDTAYRDGRLVGGFPVYNSSNRTVTCTANLLAVKDIIINNTSSGPSPSVFISTYQYHPQSKILSVTQTTTRNGQTIGGTEVHFLKIHDSVRSEEFVRSNGK